MSSENDTTLLVITGMDIAPFSARGLTQTLQHIDAAAFSRRTINGNLHDLSAAQFRKFKSTINCNDQQAPALNGIWPGQQLTVDCVAELSYLTGSGSPARPVVPGSSRTDGEFTFYRPRLIMRVTGFTTSKDEYGAVTSWSMDLEEI